MDCQMTHMKLILPYIKKFSKMHAIKYQQESFQILEIFKIKLQIPNNLQPSKVKLTFIKIRI